MSLDGDCVMVRYMINTKIWQIKFDQNFVKMVKEMKKNNMIL
jgi:hypothetical protein